MSKVLFAMGIHNHQPVGNFDFVIEDAYQKSYLPFLDALEVHPKIRISLHFSGVLLDWIVQEHPDYVERIRKLVSRGQLEMISGAHYEPILMAIPDEDKLGQIQKLTRQLVKLTGYDPNGFWLAERVWEPHLPKVLREAGARYTVLDDSHFKYAGLKQDQLAGYYVTEEQGNSLFVFPISEKLRYTIPFEDPEETMTYIRNLGRSGENKVAIFADDGEKFGVWPGTYEHVFEKGWLESLFRELEKAEDEIEMVHFSEVIERLPPVGTVYLPSASYREMMEWALPFSSTRELEDFEEILKGNGLFEQYSIYVRGGFWRNFLAKYPETNRMHKKMLFVSQKVNKAAADLSKKEKDEALCHLWAGQCNCAYWHGVFGGIYLPHLRNAIYKNLIHAENVISKHSNGDQISFTEADFSGDGKNSILVETGTLSIYIDPGKGGSIFELDYKPRAVNLLDTMTRREEAYHRRLLKSGDKDPEGKVASIHDLVVSKEENLDKYLTYDRYDRGSLIDHFLTPETTLDQFADGSYKMISEFFAKEYEVKMVKPEGISLSSQASVRNGQLEAPVGLEKKLKFSASKSTIEVFYRIINHSNSDQTFFFGVEWNISLLAGQAHDRYYDVPGREIGERHLASKGSIEDVSALSLVDEWQRVKMSFLYDEAALIWRFPIETISVSESGFERVFQNSCVFAGWKFSLNSGDEKEIGLSCEISSL